MARGRRAFCYHGGWLTGSRSWLTTNRCRERGWLWNSMQDFVDAVCADHGLSHEEHALITSHIAMKSESEQI